MLSHGAALLLIACSAALDVGANMLLDKSDGFRNKKLGFLAIFMVCGAFTLLAQVTKTIELTVAYVTWGAMAILGTVACGRIFLGQRLNWRGWLGLVVIVASIAILKTA